MAEDGHKEEFQAESLDVTMYLVAAPAVNVTIALFVIAEPPTVPVIVAAPLWVPAVSVAR